MKYQSHSPGHPMSFSIAVWSLLLIVFTCAAPAAEKLWRGAGTDGRWMTGGNWVGGIAPTAGDSLIFTNTVRLQNTNNFVSGTSFSGITFALPSGGFSLWGNLIALDGGITNNQVVTEQTINLPLSLSATRDVNVAESARLRLAAEVSGAGGLTKHGLGELTLAADNVFTGPLTIQGGTATVSSDSNLGATPGGATPGSIVIDGGALRVTTDLTIDPNRGIAVGPTAGSGNGTITTDSGDDVTYAGIIANNGGTGGLIKSGFGSLTLSAANTYTGPTDIRVGTLTLDFTQAGSPANNVIDSASSLSIGGENSGAGTSSFGSLIMNGAAGLANSQTFNGTTITLGPARIQANSGAAGSATLALGELTHTPGGAVAIDLPTDGNITTTSTNVNGILGGWAVYSEGTVDDGVMLGTHWAAVDESGNIIPFSYTNLLAYTSGHLNDTVTAADNLLFDFTTATVVRVDDEGAGTTTDVNSIVITNVVAGTTLTIGEGNTLRLGKFGGIMRVGPSTASWYLGGTNDTPQGGNGQVGSSSIGKLTAGGAPDTDGEIVLTLNSTGPTAGGNIFEAEIADNGSGVVTVVKTGNSSSKVAGHNTFSGGLIIHAGRLQLTGTEIDDDANPDGNPDGGGTGPIYILPGAQLFPSGIDGLPITNEMYVAGAGFNGNGAIRFGTMDITGTVNLLGDVLLSGNNSFNTNSRISGKITGPFSFGLGMNAGAENFGTCIVLFNTENDWSGDTLISCSTTRARNTTMWLGASEVIPDGFGKGSVILRPNSQVNSGLARIEMDGNDETINGITVDPIVGSLFHQAIVQNNRAGSTSTLTVGNNDASSTFAGRMQDANGTLSLRKIGRGVLTMTSTNAYNGDTIVEGGTLAITGSGSLTSPNIRLEGGALDVAEVNGGTYAAANSVRMDGGTLVANTVLSSIPNLAMTNSGLTVLLNSLATNVVASSFTTGGDSNVVNIVSVAGISGYPAEFTIVKYSGALGGVGQNFVIGDVPSEVTSGFFSNDVASSRLILVLTNGPKILTWTGNDVGSPNLWDEGGATNWLAFKGTINEEPAPFFAADAVNFDDTAATSVIDLSGSLIPGSVSVNNSSLDFYFTGSGALGGFGGLAKSGSGTLTLLNTGGDGYRGGVTVNGGTLVFGSDHGISGGATIAAGTTVDVGTNGTSGNLPSGAIANEGTIRFNRSSDLTTDNAISGAGDLIKNEANVLTMSGVSTFTGDLLVNTGTLRAGNGAAFGDLSGATTISSGSVLDVNGQSLGSEPIIVSGTGIGDTGAIINSGGGTTTALRDVTLAGDTTFGGVNRWDIRLGDGVGRLNTDGNTYHLTKVGPNQVSLVGVEVDFALGDIIVKEGIFAVETTASSLGNPANTLSVSNGATLQFFSASQFLEKNMDLYGDGVVTTLNLAGTGAANVFGTMNLNGNVIVNNAGGADSRINSSITGTANVVILGAATNWFMGSVSYVGSTTVSNTLVIVNGTKTSGTGMTFNGGGLAGDGSVSESVAITNGVLQPGVFSLTTLTVGGNLTVSGTTVTFDLDSVPGGADDRVSVGGNLVLDGVNVVRIEPQDFLQTGDIYTIMTYTGSLVGDTNNLQISAPPGYTISFVDPATTPNEIQIKVDHAIKNLFWVGNTSTLWDVDITLNWDHNDAGFANSTFTNLDIVNFDNRFVNATNVTLVGALEPTRIVFANVFETMRLIGSGHITGGSVMRLQGEQPVYVENTGSNDFTGPVVFNSRNLYVASGGLGNGPLFMTNVTVETLNFVPTGTLHINNNIQGGFGQINQDGSGTTRLNGANTHTTAIVVMQGTLATGNAAALGATNGTTTVSSGATLDVDGRNLGSEQVVAGGPGVGNAGAIVNNGTNAQTQALRFVTLTEDTTFGGTWRWDIRGGPAALLSGGLPVSITKVGTNQVSLVGVAEVDSAILNIDIQEGVFALQTSTAQVGDPAGTITIHDGATLNFFNLATPLNKLVDVQDGGTVWNENNVSTIVGNMTLNGDVTFNAGGTSLVLSNNTISGAPDSITKSGGGSLVLVGNSLPAVNTLSILAGTLDLSQASVTDLSLTSGQTLRGHGTIIGDVLASGAAVISPGPNGENEVGTLTVQDAVVLPNLGQTRVDVNATATSNDRIVTTSITYGGALIVTNIEGTLVTGTSYQLFDAASYTGSFSSFDLPPLADGLSWSNSLSIDGRLTIIGEAVPPVSVPHIVGAVRSGSDLVLSGTNGTPNGEFMVISATNIALPLDQWTIVSTNTFESDGSFSVTNAIDSAQPAQFFDLLQQVP